MRMRCSSDIVDMSIATRCWPPSSVANLPGDGSDHDGSRWPTTAAARRRAHAQEPRELQGLLDLSVAARPGRERPEVHQGDGGTARARRPWASGRCPSSRSSLSWLFITP